MMMMILCDDDGGGGGGDGKNDALSVARITDKATNKEGRKEGRRRKPLLLFLFLLFLFLLLCVGVDWWSIFFSQTSPLLLSLLCVSFSFLVFSKNEMLSERKNYK